MISYATRPSSARAISATSGAMLPASFLTGMTTDRSMPLTMLGRRPDAANIAAGIEALETRQHLFGKQRDVGPGEVVRHAAIAEDADQRAAIGSLAIFRQPPVDLLGRPPHLKLGKEIDERVDPVLFDVGGQLAVIFIPRDVGQALVVELVMFERRAAVAADIALEHVARDPLVLMDRDKSGDDRLWRLAAVQLAVMPAIIGEFGFGRRPRLLRDDQEAEPAAQLQGLRRDRRCVGAPAERAERRRPDRDRRLAIERAVIGDRAGLQPIEQRLGIFEKALPRFAHLGAKPLKLDPPETAADAENEAPLRQIVEDRDLLGEPDRIVPG